MYIYMYIYVSVYWCMFTVVYTYTYTHVSDSVCTLCMFAACDIHTHTYTHCVKASVREAALLPRGQLQRKIEQKERRDLGWSLVEPTRQGVDCCTKPLCYMYRGIPVYVYVHIRTSIFFLSNHISIYLSIYSFSYLYIYLS